MFINGRISFINSNFSAEFLSHRFSSMIDEIGSLIIILRWIILVISHKFCIVIETSDKNRKTRQYGVGQKFFFYFIFAVTMVCNSLRWDSWPCDMLAPFVMSLNVTSTSNASLNDKWAENYLCTCEHSLTSTSNIPTAIFVRYGREIIH